MGKSLISTILILAVTLCGCGGGGGGDNSIAAPSNRVDPTSPSIESSDDEIETLKPEFVRLWELSEDEFLLVAADKAIWMQPNTDHECYQVEKLNIQVQDESNILLYPESGESLNMEFQAIDEENISISYGLSGANQITRNASSEKDNLLSFVPVNPLCNASDSAQSISAKMSLVEVPGMVKVDRIASANVTTELDWATTFDLNDSGRLDAGDVSIHLSNIKRAENHESIVPITELQSRMVIYASEDIGYALQDRVMVTAENTELTLSIEVNSHPLLSLITENTGAYGSSSVFYETPEMDAFWTGVVDGPWNWTSAFHKDEFPNKPDGLFKTNQSTVQTFNPIYQINAMRDDADDTLGEAHWVDILDLEVTINL